MPHLLPQKIDRSVWPIRLAHPLGHLGTSARHPCIGFLSERSGQALERGVANTKFRLGLSTKTSLSFLKSLFEVWALNHKHTTRFTPLRGLHLTQG